MKVDMRIWGLLMGSVIYFDCTGARAENFNTAQNGNSLSPNLGYDTRLTLSAPTTRIWAGDVGESFRNGAWEFEGTLGAGLGLRNASRYVHHIALTELRVGRIMTDDLGKGHCYEGNVEILGEVFVGAQFHPQARYLVSGAPVLRYNFMTGTRWVPFVDGGAGLAATAIGHPDLGANWEFALQAGPGVKYYFRDNASFVMQYRYLHFSNGGLYANNHGINENLLLLGISWGF